jgi:omega-amidase
MRLQVLLAFETASLQPDMPPAHVIVLPELADRGYSALKQGEGVHTEEDEYVRQFRTISRRAHCTCIAGSLAIRNTRGVMTNSSLVFRNGACIHRYDKIHLFPPGGDTRFFRAGSTNKVFTVALENTRVRAGVIICYDLRFPELVRMLAMGGMQVLFVPARWPLVRDDAWQTLLKARAIENQIFVVGCNGRGTEGGFSYVFDPLGRLVMSSRDNPSAELIDVQLDLELIREAQALHRNLQDAVLLKKIRFPVRSSRMVR